MLYTRTGAQVVLTHSYKNYADCGVFLVQARIVCPSPIKASLPETEGQIIEGRDAFSNGWFPANHLIADAGPQELLNTVLNTPDGTPVNARSLCRLHWPALFGPMQMDDVITRSIQSEETPSNRLGEVIGRFSASAVGLRTAG